jgi:hypothetical protein
MVVVEEHMDVDLQEDEHWFAESAVKETRWWHRCRCCLGE